MKYAKHAIHGDVCVSSSVSFRINQTTKLHQRFFIRDSSNAQQRRDRSFEKLSAPLVSAIFQVAPVNVEFTRAILHVLFPERDSLQEGKFKPFPACVLTCYLCHALYATYQLLSRVRSEASSLSLAICSTQFISETVEGFTVLLANEMFR